MSNTSTVENRLRDLDQYDLGDSPVTNQAKRDHIEELRREAKVGQTPVRIDDDIIKSFRQMALDYDLKSYGKLINLVLRDYIVTGKE